VKPEVVKEMIELRAGSGARLRVNAFGGGGSVTVEELDVLVQSVVLVLPDAVFVQVTVLVLMFVPLITVVVVAVVLPVVVVVVVVELVAVAGWNAVGERTGASTIDVG
jgi:hypothetical protein